MTTYSWTLGSDGSWFTSTNWSPSAVPNSSTDSVVLNAAGSYVITLDTASASIQNLSILSTATGAEVTFDASRYLTVYGTLSLAAGSVNVSYGSSGISAAKGSTSSLSISGGTLAETAGSVALGTGGVTVSSGALTLSGGTFSSGGTLAISGTGSSLTINGVVATITGATSFTGGNDAIQSGSLTASSFTFGGSNHDVAFSGGTITASSSTASSILATDTLSMSNSALLNLTNDGGTIAGTLSGYGKVEGSLTGSGVVDASGGTLTLTSAIASTNIGFQVDANSILNLGSTIASGNTVTFNSSASGLVQFAAPSSNTFSGITLSGMNVGSSNTSPTNDINLTNVTFDKATLSVTDSTDGTITLANGSTTVATFTLSNVSGNLTNAYVDWQPDGSLGGQDVFLSTVVCFAAGTCLLTPRGPAAVEHLAEGDQVVTHTGEAQPIRWIGHRRIDLAAHPRPQLVAPVRIRRDAFGEALPQRDLLVSPDHCIFADGRLIPAKLLINGMTIVHELSARSVEYYHVELDRHAILLAEDLPTESYLDTGNRAYFANSGLALVLHPEFTVNAALKVWETDACAPLTLDAVTVAPIWQRLADRAEALGFAAPQPETTSEPDLHVLANGRTIRPISVKPGRYQFALPAGTDSVRLASRAGMPSALCAYRDDWRNLGVAVSRIELRAQGTHTVIPADHPALRRGWHTVESDGATTWRWTDGDAELHLGGSVGPAILDVHVCNTTAYVVDAAPVRERLAA